MLKIKFVTKTELIECFKYFIIGLITGIASLPIIIFMLWVMFEFGLQAYKVILAIITLMLMFCIFIMVVWLYRVLIDRDYEGKN